MLQTTATAFPKMHTGCYVLGIRHGMGYILRATECIERNGTD